MKVHFGQAKGRVVLKYPREVMAQEQYVQVYSDGTVYFSVNAEIGNAVPESVWNGKVRRITFNRTVSEVMTGALRRQFYRENKDLFQRLADGMGERYDGNNYVGTLTEDAQDAEQQLERNAEDFYGYGE